VGQLSEPFLRDGCRLFSERILRFTDLRVLVVPEEKIAGKGKEKYIRHQEGQRIRQKLAPAAFTVVVDERGTLLSSTTFATYLEKWSNAGLKEIAFVLGGPFGLEEALRKEGDFCLSLSTMTLTHGLARLLLLEQIYRAFTILRGDPYHK